MKIMMTAFLMISMSACLPTSQKSQTSATPTQGSAQKVEEKNSALEKRKQNLEDARAGLKKMLGLVEVARNILAKEYSTRDTSMAALIKQVSILSEQVKKDGVDLFFMEPEMQTTLGGALLGINGDFKVLYQQSQRYLPMDKDLVSKTLFNLTRAIDGLDTKVYGFGARSGLINLGR